MRILFVAPYIPSRIRVRSYNLIRTLAAQGHHVHLVALQPPEDRFASAAELRQVCAQADVFPLSRARTLWNALKALPTSLPLQAAYSHHPQAERRIRDLAKQGRFDVLHVEHLRGAVLAERLSGIPRVFDSVDSIAYLFEQASRLAPKITQRLMARVDLPRTRRFEARAPRRFERILTTSPVDAQAIRDLAGDAADSRIRLLPNGVDLDFFRPVDTPPDPATILFSGKISYHANSAAVLYLGREVMPRVWQQRPDARLMIVGKDPTPAVRALGADPRVTVTGYVEDLRPYFARATVSATPLLYGAGTQYKVLEAMASGVPVVATPRVGSGLQAQPDRDLLVGEDTGQLARCIVRLIDDARLRREIGAAGRRYVERYHSWPQIAATLAAIYAEARAAPLTTFPPA
jgi:sugar transferase (PEP-CTERM/EpsH1 system associated)